MAKRTAGFTFSTGNPEPDRFRVEVKGLSTGKWCPQVGVPDDRPATIRAMMRAQGSEWMLDKREWRVVPA
jgi:hypothetical protein